MGATGTQRLESSILGWEVEDSVEYEDIRTDDQYEVHPSCKEGNNEAVGSADPCVSAGNLDEGHELTVGVGNDIGSAVGEPAEQEGVRTKQCHAPEYDSQAHSPDYSMCQNS